MDLEKIITNELVSFGVKSAIKGVANYNFSSTICINNSACNQPPSQDIIIKSGDLLTIDIPIKTDSLVYDVARSIVVGSISEPLYNRATSLCNFSGEINRYALDIFLGCETIGDLEQELIEYAKKNGFHLVNLPFGHISGVFLHLFPSFSRKFKDILISDIVKEPVIFTLEPIVSTCDKDPVLDIDGWNWKLPLGELACYNENVVLVTKEKKLIMLC